VREVGVPQCRVQRGGKVKACAAGKIGRALQVREVSDGGVRAVRKKTETGVSVCVQVVLCEGSAMCAVVVWHVKVRVWCRGGTAVCVAVVNVRVCSAV